MEHNRVQHDLVTQVANYLKVNVYQLFELAKQWEDKELPLITAKVDYDQFIRNGTVPNYVHEYCELIIYSME